MGIFTLLRLFATSMFTRFGWPTLGGAIALHALITFMVLRLAREEHLTQPSAFLYWYVTTTSTVGYGDLSPQSALGRHFVAIWVMLGGIALITTVIGKGTSTVIEFWRAKLKGKRDFSGLSDHTVLVGWHGEDSEKIVQLLLEDSTSNDDHILLCDCTLEENPLPERIAFVRGESLTSAILLARAGVRSAGRVLVFGHSDDETLAIVLTINDLQPKGHVVAHFNSSDKARLARSYAPSLECTSNLAIEMLVRSSQDPGSSAVINELLSIGEGATQFSLGLPGSFSGTFGELFMRLKQQHNATLIGYRAAPHSTVQINPQTETRISGGEIFYIAEKRLNLEATHGLA